MTTTTRLVHDSNELEINGLRRNVLFPITIAFVILVVFFATKPNLPMWAVMAPFAVSILVFGLPHGALDHLVPSRLAGRRPSVKSIASVAVIYVLVAAGVLVVWSTAPAAAFVGFIALTWFHWGQGDLWIDLAGDDPGRLRSRTLRAGTVFVRGGLPMLLPLVFHPGTYELVRVGTVELFGQGTGSVSLLALGSTVRTIIGTSFALIVLVMAVSTWHAAHNRNQRAAWARDQIEIAVLALFFAVGPPVLTVGLYFCLWHSLRHIARLELLDPQGAGFLSRGEFVRAARRFAADAAPITVIAILMLGAMYFVLPPLSDGPEAILAPYLVLISALTVPHVAIVSYMDARQGVWARA